MSDAAISFLDARVAGDETASEADQEFANAAGRAIQGLQRFLNIVLVHTPDNDAVQSTLGSTYEALMALVPHSDGRVVFTFVGHTIFVCGELLKAPRRIYDAAMKLAGLLKRCGASEIGFEDSLETSDLMLLGKVLRAAATGHAELLLGADVPNVVVREVDAMLESREDDADRPLEERIIDLYATSLVALRRYFAAIATGKYPSPSRVKRIAQRLVSLSQDGDAALIGMTGMAHAHRDDAGRALQCAILSVSLARRITNDHIALSRIAMEALICDAGRVALAGETGRDRLVPLPPRSDVYVPMATAAVSIAGGGISRAAATHTIAAYEATWLEREAQLGSLYGGEFPPLVQSRILRTVRALVDRLAPRDTSPALNTLDALQDVLRQPDIDASMRRLLISVMGFIPVGTVVELSDGYWAVVQGPSANPEALSMPRVRIVSDSRGVALDRPYELDLGSAQNDAGLSIAKIIEEAPS